MRINIKTQKPVKDRDVRALYMIDAAIKQSTERMKIENLRFIAGRYGYQLTPR